MGCSKPPTAVCPKNPHGLSFVCCASDCEYFFWEGLSGTGASFCTVGLAKTIDQFTTDELLAEIRRRMK